MKCARAAPQLKPAHARVEVELLSARAIQLTTHMPRGTAIAMHGDVCDPEGDMPGFSNCFRARGRGSPTSFVISVADNIVAPENVPDKNVAFDVESEFESDIDESRHFSSS
jgi:hypothetical protein